MSSSLVKVSDLKNRLSHYLRRVRSGEVLLVCDRDSVIARIEAAGSRDLANEDDAAWVAALEREGKLRRPSNALSRSWRKERPRVEADVVGALIRERDEGR